MKVTPVLSVKELGWWRARIAPEVGNLHQTKAMPLKGRRFFFPKERRNEDLVVRLVVACRLSLVAWSFARFIRSLRSRRPTTRHPPPPPATATRRRHPPPPPAAATRRRHPPPPPAAQGVAEGGVAYIQRP